jgi:hypothetical protein
MTSTMLCPEGLTFATLAAWHDGTLDAAEAARVRSHVTGCAACRAALSSLSTQDTVLRQLPAPEPDDRLWRAVRGRMRGERPARSNVTASRGRLVGGIAAVAAVLLVALGFAQVFRDRPQPTAGATPTAVAGTPTLLPTAVAASPAVNGPHPNWQRGTLPVASLTDQDILSFGVAPAHGNEAYACFGTSDRSGATLTVYRTTDRSAHWTTQTQITVPSLDLSDCMVQVDAYDGNRVLIQVMGQNMDTMNGGTSFEYTDDGGATWSQLNESIQISEPATVHGATYALIWPPLSATNGTAHLSVSTDNWRQWRPVDQALVGARQAVSNFWINPGGELLAEVTTETPSATPTTSPTGPVVPFQGTTSLSLWRSSDGGAHWRQFSTPRIPSAALARGFVVQQPSAGQPWQLCEVYGMSGGGVEGLACTFDDGHTWSARPLLCVSAPCVPMYLGIQNYALASDGYVLMMALAPGTHSQLGIYRLPQGATTWQYLGPTAGSNAYFFAPTPGGGILWAYAGGTYTGRLSGIIGGQQMLPGVIATATYS